MLKLLLSLLLLLSFAACFDKSPKVQTDNQYKDQKNNEKYKKISKNKHIETTTTDTANTKKLDNTAENKDKVEKEENKPAETTATNTADTKKSDHTSKDKEIKTEKEENKPVETTTTDTADTKKLDNTSKNKDKVEKIDIIKQKEEESLNQLLKNIDPSRIKHYLNVVGNDNKEKAALDLIAHENFLNNLFTQFNIGALNDDCLAFNANIKEEIKNKIKNEKIIENIDIKNFTDNNISNILINLNKLPEYLNNDENIIKQIQNNINKQMDIKKNSEYIISEFIHYNFIFQNENVTKAIITAIAEHINKIATDKSANREFANYMIQKYTSLQIFKFFNILKNNLNDNSKKVFEYIMFIKISQYQNKDDLNNNFGKEIDKLKEFIQQFVDNITQDNQKDNVAKVKSLLSI